MKIFVLAFVLFAMPILAKAQASASERLSSRYYGWFRDADWTRDQLLGAPGWEIRGDTKDVDGWHYLAFGKLDESQFIAYRLREGTIDRVTYVFAKTAPEARAWRTASLERVGENEWIDRANNGRVKRYFNGNTVDYRVTYEPFTKD